MIKAKIIVTLKNDVMDPQGQAVEQSIKSLGYDNVSGVRVGRYFDVVVESDDMEATKAQLEELCDKLLANVVIECYTIELQKC